MKLSKFFAFQCLATSASSHLGLGQQEVGHEGVATGRRDLSLPARCRARSALSAFQCSICLARKWAAVSTAFVSESPIK
jgi:hypothetical protein